MTDKLGMGSKVGVTAARAPVEGGQAAAFTPGLWAAEDGNWPHVGKIVITAPGMNARSPLAIVSTLGDEHSALADARLIAAAPELLACLKQVFVDQCMSVENGQRSLAAIAKAEGR